MSNLNYTVILAVGFLLFLALVIFAIDINRASSLPKYQQVECVNLPAPVVDNSTQVRLDACIGKLYELQNKYWVNGSWCGK